MTGTVYLVGAGPGRRGLLTLRAQEVLERADVVYVDALVGGEILPLIPEEARVVYVGKRAGNHTMPQEEISRHLYEDACAGLTVVRLKGGDPFLFGRGGEELELLAEHGIPFEVVPGVTSAFSVPAYNGIPVTHRDYTASVHVITGHRRKGETYDIDFQALVETRGTLLFLMGLSSLPDIRAGLLKAGMDPATPAAVLSRGTTARQRRVVATLQDIEEEVNRAALPAPAIIVVGGVCALAESFSWFEKKPLAGCRVVVTRPKELISEMARKLREAGAEVWEIPAIETVPLTKSDPCEEVLSGIAAGTDAYDWLVFTSPSGVRIFLDALLQETDVRQLAAVKIAAIGSGTGKALKQYGLIPDFVPSVYDGETLGRELRQSLSGGERVLIPRAAIGNPELVRELTAGPEVTICDLPLYETRYVKSRFFDLAARIEEGELDYAVFTSASTVRGFAEAAEGAELTQVRAICIGRQTEQAAKAYGMRTYVADRATMESVVERLIEVAGRERTE